MKRLTPLKAKTALKAKKSLKAAEKPRKQAKTAIPKLRKEADKYFSLAIRYRDCELKDGQWIGNCITCERPVSLKKGHCGHFMSRRHPATRWDEMNCALQCASCNMFGAGEQYKFAVALDLLYGLGTAKQLQKKSQEDFKVTRQFLEEVINDAKAEVDWYAKLEVGD
jgi:hypothetical protein